MEIPFSEFLKLEIRVGEVLEATPIPGSKNLIKMIVNFGFEKRQSVAGLFNYYKPADLINHKYVFVLNLQQRKIMGVESQCMILAAEDSKDNVSLIHPDKDVEIGSRIR